MPASLSFPGVYIEEIPSGIHTITGVSTSICAFVGTAPLGPVDTPTEIFSFADFESQFGPLALDASGAPDPLGFAVRDFFLNGGSDAIVVRVSAAKNGGDATAATAAPIGGALTLQASSSGTWGNSLQAQVDFATRDTTNKNLFNLTIQQLGSDGKSVTASERFQNLSTRPSDPTYVVGYLAANSTLVVADDTAGKTLTQPAAPAPPPSPPAGGAPPAPVAPAQPLAKDGIAAFIPLAGGKTGTPDPNDIIGDPLKKSGLHALDKADLFNILVLPGLATVSDPAPAGGAAAADALPGAYTAIVAAAAQYCATRRAMLLIDPPARWNGWNADPAATLTKILTDIGVLRDANASYAAVYFPNIIKSNPLRNLQLESFPPSGTVAGIFARTDTQRAVWKAPAGLQALLTDAPQLAASLTNPENGKLNAAGVNCLRAFPIVGRVVWGARTLDGADILESDYKYVPVRRFTLFLEESLYRGTQWVVFEPNDEPLWSQIRLNVGSFMHDLFRQGAFAGATPKDAYFVKCDAESTTQSDIDHGIVNIVVGFAPLKPAEFVVLQIQQIAGQLAT